LGRFGMRDAVDGMPGDPLTWHKYAYTRNNPVNLVDPSGHFGMAESSISMGIATSIQMQYLGQVAYRGWKASKRATELVVSRESILEAASRNPSPEAVSAAIIVHGVSHKQHGWSQSDDTPFQQNLTGPAGPTRGGVVDGLPLTHDLYEYNWGGFSLTGIGAMPLKSVHQQALVHLEMTQFLVWMNGYENIDLISHSWGTTLTYDLQNSSGIPVRHWVTMGSPLKSTTPKPPGNTGDWINMYDLKDYVVHLEMFPPFPSTSEMAESVGRALRRQSPGLASENSNVDIQRDYDFQTEYGEGWWVHGGYWKSGEAATDLRLRLR